MEAAVSASGSPSNAAAGSGGARAGTGAAAEGGPRIRLESLGEFAPLHEALLAGDELAIDPVFTFGDLSRATPSLLGPDALAAASHNALALFVPIPVITRHVQLTTTLEWVRDRLAENLHENWAMSKIEQGWSFGESRDERTRRHPYLVPFDKLPRTEKQYNLALAHETLRIILTLGYRIQIDIERVKNPSRMRTIRLPNNFLQANGYRPAPLELGDQQLSEHTTDLVQLIAENTHNVWCRDRIIQGWTHGPVEEQARKRTPHLVPFERVDPYIQQVNRDSAASSIRTLLAYGCTIEPAPPEQLVESRKKAKPKQLDQNLLVGTANEPRIYRAQSDYAVTRGRWYFEAEVVTGGEARVGWVQRGSPAHGALGTDPREYVFDGLDMRKLRGGQSEAFGSQWFVGAVISCLLDLHEKTICFEMNGERLMDSFGQDFAFKNIDTSDGYLPVVSVGPGQRVKLNFGHDVNSLKFFTCNAMHEGYQPFAVYMTRNIPLWFTNTVPSFVYLRDLPNPSVKLLPSLAGNESWPILSVQALSYSSSLPHQALPPHPNTGYTVLRLALPIVCSASYCPPQVQFRDDTPRRKIAPSSSSMQLRNVTRGAAADKLGAELGVSSPQLAASTVRRRSVDVSGRGASGAGAPIAGSPNSAQPAASGPGARTASARRSPPPATGKAAGTRSKSPFAFFGRLVSDATVRGVFRVLITSLLQLRVNLECVYCTPISENNSRILVSIVFLI